MRVARQTQRTRRPVLVGEWGETHAEGSGRRTAQQVGSGPRQQIFFIQEKLDEAGQMTGGWLPQTAGRAG